jgi:hypothetical protein
VVGAFHKKESVKASRYCVPQQKVCSVALRGAAFPYITNIDLVLAILLLYSLQICDEATMMKRQYKKKLTDEAIVSHQIRQFFLPITF